MLELMIVFGVLGLLLFCGGPVLARWIVKDARDPMGTARVLQLVGILLLVIAVVLRPHNPATAAFPPPQGVADRASTERVVSTTRSKPGGSVRDAAFQRLEHPAISM
jgi:hypothetical protein